MLGLIISHKRHTEKSWGEDPLQPSDGPMRGAVILIFAPPTGEASSLCQTPHPYPHVSSQRCRAKQLALATSLGPSLDCRLGLSALWVTLGALRPPAKLLVGLHAFLVCQDICGL